MPKVTPLPDQLSLPPRTLWSRTPASGCLLVTPGGLGAGDLSPASHRLPHPCLSLESSPGGSWGPAHRPARPSWVSPATCPRCHTPPSSWTPVPDLGVPGSLTSPAPHRDPQGPVVLPPVPGTGTRQPRRRVPAGRVGCGFQAAVEGPSPAFLREAPGLRPRMGLGEARNLQECNASRQWVQALWSGGGAREIGCDCCTHRGSLGCWGEERGGALGRPRVASTRLTSHSPSALGAGAGGGGCV